MYELWIKSSSGVWMLADLPEDKIAMIYQANDIAQLNQVKGNLSQKIYLPMSKKNCEIFDYVNEYDAVSDVPYKKLECRLYCNNISLTGGAALPQSSPRINLIRVSSTFECQIQGSFFGIFKWFEMLQFKEDGELGLLFPELGSYVREKKAPTSSLIQKGVGFGALASSENGLTLTDETYTCDRAIPYVKFTMMLDWVSQILGLEFVYDIPEIDRIATLVTELNETEGSLSPFTGVAQQEGGAPPLNNYIKWKIYTNPSTGEPADANGHLSIEEQYRNKVYYSAPYSGYATFHFQCSTGSGSSTVKNLTDGSIWKGSFHSFSSGSGIDVHFDKGDRLEIQARGSNLSGTDMYILNPRTDNGVVPIGGRVSIRENLGFKNFKDYFAAMLQALGLFVDYDASKHVMYLAIADNIYKNKEKSIDWSKKLHHGEKGATSYTALDYAQSNSINFEDDKNTGFKDSITFYVDNENLKEHKDLFKLKFEAGDNQSVFGMWNINGKQEERSYPSAIVPLYKVEDNELNFIGSGKPRIVFIDNKVNLVVNGISFPHVKNAKASELINTFYDKLINGILKKSKSREDEFYLTSQDIEDYNQFVPIYIDYYGAYFYVNKIHNFMEESRTLCELIQL